MAKKNFIRRSRQKDAFRRGFREAAGISKSSPAARAVLGDEALAADVAEMKKYYKAGRQSAAAVAARRITVEQAFEVAERQIDEQPEERGFEVVTIDEDEADVDEAVIDLAEFDVADADDADDDEADDDEADADEAELDEADE